MNKLVTIKTFTYAHEAYVLKTHLESEGITCYIQDDITVQVIGFYSNAIGGVKLKVAQKDVEKALAIIDTI